MQPLTGRAYAGAADRDAALALWLAARRGPLGDPWPPLDRIRQELADQAADAHVWEDGRGALAGAALLLDGCVLERCARAGADDECLEVEMVAWGLETAARAARSSGERPALFVPIRAHEWRLAAALERGGFREDAWHTLRLRRSLRAPIEAPWAPPGVAIRPAADERDIAAAAALHGALFAGGQNALRERQTLMRAPGYRPALDLVAANGHGRIVGYALGRRCPLEQQELGQALGWVEYIGVAADRRRCGLGRALTLALLGALRAEGLETAWASVGAANTAAQALFSACGFRAAHRVRWYVHEDAQGEGRLAGGAGFTYGSADHP